jgi:peptidoglycan/xylan/chitin deacetylase (PgdA/CDA1 family)
MPPYRAAGASDRDGPAVARFVPARLFVAGPRVPQALPRADWRTGPGRPGIAVPDVRLAEPAALHVPTDSAVRLEFTLPMNAASVQRGFHIEPAVPGTLDWPDARTLVFHPAAALASRTTYRVSVAGFPIGERRLAAYGSFAFRTMAPPPNVAVPFMLTFDDCGSAEAIRGIMAELADRGVHAIFFPTGACRDQFPWLVPALVADGHRVCNHTYSHPFLPSLSSAAVRSEIARGVSVGCDLFRPPYGAMDRGGRIAGIAASMGYRVQLWDVDTRDWAGTPADVMVAMIRARGGVVLMHMHGTHTLEALRQL